MLRIFRNKTYYTYWIQSFTPLSFCWPLLCVTFQGQQISLDPYGPRCKPVFESLYKKLFDAMPGQILYVK